MVKGLIMEFKYNGVWPTMITAFNEANQLDLDANTKLNKNLIEKAVMAYLLYVNRVKCSCFH